MPIIINDGDIVEVLEENTMKNNAITQVKVNEYEIKVDDESSSSYNITQTETANSIYNNDYAYEDEDGLEVLSLIHNTSKIEAYYTTGSFTIQATNFGVKNVSWEITGNRKGSLDAPVSFSGSISNTPVSELGNASNYDGSSVTFTQNGLWCGGVAKFGKAQLVDESYVSISTTNNVSTVTYKILTKLCVAKDYAFLVSDKTGAIYEGSDITFKISSKTVTANNVRVRTIGNKDDKTITLDDNQLNTISTYYSAININQYNGQEILKKWKNGRDSCKIKVIVGEYYNENGDLAISSRDNEQILPMLFNIGDIVTPYIKVATEYTENDNTYMAITNTGISTYGNGDAKRFIVINETYIDDGVCTQELDLVEYASICVLTIKNDKFTNVTVNRVSSNLEGAKLGVLTDNILYGGDIVSISITKDYSDSDLNFSTNLIPTGVEGQYRVSAQGTNDTAYIKALRKNALNYYTWEEIAEISEKGDAITYFDLGEEKTFTINEQTYTAVIIGFEKDYLQDSTEFAGMTFAFKEPLDTKYRMNQTATNSGGWADSYIRNTVMPQVLQTLPSDLQSVIKTVEKRSGKGGGTDTSTNTTNDKLWLLSAREIFGNDSTYIVGGTVYEFEGHQYNYFTIYKDYTITQDRINLAGISYTTNPQSEYVGYSGVTRSAGTGNNTDGFFTMTSSTYMTLYTANSRFYIFPCFCI